MAVSRAAEVPGVAAVDAEYVETASAVEVPGVAVDVGFVATGAAPSEATHTQRSKALCDSTTTFSGAAQQARRWPWRRMRKRKRRQPLPVAWLPS